MTIKVTVSNPTNIVSKIKQQKSVISSVNSGSSKNLILNDLIDVNADAPDEGDILQFNAETNEYDIKPLIVSANNLPYIDGGTF